MTDQTFFDAVGEVAWPEESGVARAIIVLIFAMSGWAALQTLGNASRIAGERIALGRAAAALKKWRDALETKSDDGSPPPFPRLSLEELANKLADIRGAAGRDSHVAKLVAAIQTLRIHHMKVNVASLQQVVERDEATRPGMSTPAHVANFAVMLGILGTFWGLGHMVTAIGGALPDRGVTPTIENWARTVEQIRHVLSGMRTAFSTSLVGMCCSIGAGLASAYLTSAQQRLLQALEAFTVNELLPATVPTLEDDSVLEQVSGQLERAFSHIDDIAQQNQKSLSELNAVQVLFRTIVEDVRAITHGDAKRDVSGVLEAVLGSNAAVQHLVAELPRLTNAVEKVTSRPPPPPFAAPVPPPPFDFSTLVAEPHARPRAKGFSALHLAVLLGCFATLAFVVLMNVWAR